VQVSRAAYMALFVWQDQAPLSSMCDEDVKSCKAKNPLVANYPGKILDCLTTKAGRSSNTTAGANLKNKLSEDCNTILSIAQPPDVKTTFDTYFQVCTRLVA
jgi:golgi apparatus protein 1